MSFLRFSSLPGNYRQLSANFRQFLAIFINFRQYLPIFTNFSQFPSISANFSQFEPISVNFGQFVKGEGQFVKRRQATCFSRFSVISYSTLHQRRHLLRSYQLIQAACSPRPRFPQGKSIRSSSGLLRRKTFLDANPCALRQTSHQKQGAVSLPSSKRRHVGSLKRTLW